METNTLPIPKASPPAPELIETVVLRGDLAKLTTAQRLNYYLQLCERYSLDPITRPFEYIILDGRMTLYATKSCAEQLRVVHCISCKVLSRGAESGVYSVTVEVSSPSRVDNAIGSVPLPEEPEAEDFSSDKLYREAVKQYRIAYANATMKAETKAKRRGTLSICGLTLLDETELDTTSAKKVGVTADESKIHEISEGDYLHLLELIHAASVVTRNKTNQDEVRKWGGGRDLREISVSMYKAMCGQLESIIATNEKR